MIKQLFRGALAAVVIRLLDDYRHVSVRLLRIEAAKACLHGVRMARLSAIVLMRIGFGIALVGAGVVLLHAGLFVLLPWTVKVKAVLGMCLGLGYAAVGCAALRAVLSEKTWMEKSGAARMLDDAIDRSRMR